MAEILKPSGLNKIWANTGDKVAPDDAKITQGWVVQKPPYQYVNFLDNKQDSAIAHINQHGIAVWDSETEYQANKSYVQNPTDGVLYRCILTHTNQPVTNATYWIKAFTPASEAYTKSESDGRFLRIENNFSDVANKSTARTNLGTNDIANLNTGTLPVARGGTGVGTSTGSGSVVLSASPALTGTPTAPTAPVGTSTTQIASTAFVLQNSVPSGTVITVATNTSPLGYLKCNGAAVSRTTYASLFSAIGTTFGGGNGTTTFNLPDLRGEFVRGWDDGRTVDNGRIFGSTQAGDTASHTHTASTGSDSHTHTWSGTTSSDGNHSHTVSSDTQDGTGPYIADSNGSGGNYTVSTSANGAHTHTVSGTTSSDAHTHTVTVNSAGGTETRPRNVALLYCIKY